MANVLFDALFAPHKTSDKPFLLGRNQQNRTFRQITELAGRFATLLSSLGAKSGDRVAVQVEKSPQAVALYAACLQQGLVFLPLNTAYTATEIDYFIGDAKPAVFVCDVANKSDLQAIADANKCHLLTMGTDGTGSLTQQAQALSVTETATDRGGEDLAAILYTSGTTGRSKGAMLTHRNLLSNAITLKDYWHFTCLLYTSPSPRDATLSRMPSSA